jgi:mRNA-binding protein PUF3
VSQGLDRQQQGSQYPHQPAAFFHSQYYPSHVPQLTPPYEQYQVPNYRAQMQVADYAVPMNYMAVPMRTNRDKDPSQGVRSLLMEEFRSLNKPNRKYELKVSISAPISLHSS